MARDPYCGNCGYSLKGLTESSKCPECGKPLIDVLERGPRFTVGRRYKSKTVIFGLPLVHIALGPLDDERQGRARGIIAIGDVASGVLAIGGRACGIIAFGGLAIGIVTGGGMSLGLLAAGGWAMGGAALGGGAVGLVAEGGGVIGFVAEGGGAIGYYARGGGVIGKYVSAPYRRDAEATAFFNEWTRLIGTNPAAPLRSVAALAAWYFIGLITVAVLCALVLVPAYFRRAAAE